MTWAELEKWAEEHGVEVRCTESEVSAGLWLGILNGWWWWLRTGAYNEMSAAQDALCCAVEQIREAK